VSGEADTEPRSAAKTYGGGGGRVLRILGKGKSRKRKKISEVKKICCHRHRAGTKKLKRKISKIIDGLCRSERKSGKKPSTRGTCTSVDKTLT